MIAVSVCLATAIAVYLLLGGPGIRSARPESTDNEASEFGETPWVGNPPRAVWGDRRVLAPETESGLLIFRKVANGEAVTGLAVVCVPFGSEGHHPESVAAVSDSRGEVRLPQREWRIKIEGERYETVSDVVRATLDGALIWLRERVQVSVVVSDEFKCAIEGAHVQLWEGPTPCTSKESSDKDGKALLPGCLLTSGRGVVVTKTGYEPAYVQADESKARGGVVELAVTLRRASKAWNLLVVDGMGDPMPGVTMAVSRHDGTVAPFALGSTGPDGSLVIWGDWMLDGYRWRFNGAAYESWIDSDKIQSDRLDTSTFRIMLPRRMPGRFMFPHPVSGPGRWRVHGKPSDHDAVVHGPALVEDIKNRRADGVLPAHWPVRVDYYAADGAHYAADAEVGVPDWAVLMDLAAEPPARNVYLQSPADSIASVAMPSEPMLKSRALNSSTWEVRVPTGWVTLQVTFQTGVKQLLSGRPGKDDVVLPVYPPPLATVRIAVKDQEGQPVPDVRLRVSNTSGAEFKKTGTAGWTVMTGGGVYFLDLDAHGCSVRRLPAGEYKVLVQHLPGRESMGLGWEPHKTGSLTVSGNCINQTTIQIPRPRMMTLELVGSPPREWRLRDGIYSRVFGGDQCSVWITDSAQRITVETLEGVELERLVIPSGRHRYRRKIKVLEGR